MVGVSLLTGLNKLEGSIIRLNNLKMKTKLGDWFNGWCRRSVLNFEELMSLG